MSTGKYLNSINESQMSNSLDLNAWGVDTKLNLVGLAPVVRRLDNAQGHTQRIVSVNYLFGRPLISSDFLKRIVTSNFPDMRNLTSVVFGLLKMSFWTPKKGELSLSERR